MRREQTERKSPLLLVFTLNLSQCDRRWARSVEHLIYLWTDIGHTFSVLLYVLTNDFKSIGIFEVCLFFLPQFVSFKCWEVFSRGF